MTIFFHQAALGDWVLTFPILRALNGPVTAVSAWSKARLAAMLMDHVQPVDIEAREFSRMHAPDGPAALGPAVEQLLADARLLISFVSGPHDPWALSARRLTPGAEVIFVQPRPPRNWTGHVCEWHDQQLSQQGLELVPAMVPHGGCADGPVVVHPGSGGNEKCWPATRFEALIDTLRAGGKIVRPLLGEVELDRWPTQRLDHWRQTYGARCIESLETLHQEVADASLFVGNDAGPTHLAAQMGLRTLALFGPTRPQRWRPIGPSVEVLAPPEPAPMSWLKIEAVVEACHAAPA